MVTACSLIRITPPAVMAQQYSYGYGYGYPTTGTVGYGVNVVGYATPPPTLPPRPAQPATYQPSPYSTPKSVAPLTPQQQQQQQQTGKQCTKHCY